MGINIDLAKRAEMLAKTIAKDRHGTDGLWEMYLMEAYDQIKEDEKAPEPPNE